MRIFVEGLGRCGSSLVYASLAAAAPAHFRKGFFRCFADAPSEAGIYKTHDYPPRAFAKGDRAVYLFGVPERIVQSVVFTDRHFKEQHFLNFGREYLSDKESLLRHDGLGLLKHFRSWKHHSSGMPTMFLHYEAIWENLKLLREFTGLDVKLPKRMPPRKLPAINLKADFSDLRREMAELVFMRRAKRGSRRRR
jgi:hypothetical protein